MSIDTNMVGTVVGAAAAAAIAVNPQAAGAAGVAAVAPMVLGMLQTAMQLQTAGVMTPGQLAQLFADMGKGIASTHAQWAALNQAQAQAPVTAAPAAPATVSVAATPVVSVPSV